MARERVPNDEEARILRENQMNPEEYAVIQSTETYIRLLCYRTRDSIVIEKGDRAWS